MATMTFTTTPEATNIVLKLEDGKEIKGAVKRNQYNAPVNGGYAFQVIGWANKQLDKLSGGMVPMGIDSKVTDAVYHGKNLVLVIDRKAAVDSRVKVAR